MDTTSHSLKTTTLVTAVLAYVVSLPYHILMQTQGAAPGVFDRALDNPSVIMQWLFGTFVFTFLLAGIHVLIASCFKKQRNPISRMKILRGWSVVMLAIVSLNLLLTFLQS